MIRLDTTTRKLQAVLSSVGSPSPTVKALVAYSDATTTRYTGAMQVATLSDTAATDICAAPGASTIRDIDFISIRNPDTVSLTVTIRYNDNGTTYDPLVVTLAAGDMLHYTHSSGWLVIDKNGQLKEVLATALMAASNLSDVANVSTARTNLGFANVTRQVFTSGSSATYTRPANVRQLRVRMWGSGGGGGGTGTTGPLNGTAGNSTTFNSVTAAGGGGGDTSTALAGVGGTGGSGSASVRIPGASGGPYVGLVSSSTNETVLGGMGGGVGGGKAPSGGSPTGVAGAANSGGGGSSAATANGAIATIASTWFYAGGGGSGEYVEYIIDTPASTYTYTVGAAANGGSAGTGGSAGGNGGSGLIIVDEFC